jgi:hypothetical protein
VINVYSLFLCFSIFPLIKIMLGTVLVFWINILTWSASTSIYMTRHGNTINQDVAVIFVVANVCDYKFNFLAFLFHLEKLAWNY